MSKYTTKTPLFEFSLWEKLKKKRGVVHFELEITARCNNNCSHCYINYSPSDKEAQARELSFSEISDIADDAVSLGAIWCLISGGEPLLRKDFKEIYIALMRKGLLVSVFTNATLIRDEHIRLFKRYPPRDLEITVYGVTKKTYEKVTKVPGSFRSFKAGFELIKEAEIPVNLKAIAMRSNYHELGEIEEFCRKHSRSPFRFDPFLHLRYDRDKEKNKSIKAERLSPEEIILLEKNDSGRFQSLKNNCDQLIQPELVTTRSVPALGCGAGLESFNVGYDGMFRLCSSLFAPSCVYNLREGSLIDAWENFVPKVRARTTTIDADSKSCRQCGLVNLCMACPAINDLETGDCHSAVQDFCLLAQRRMEMLKDQKK